MWTGDRDGNTINGNQTWPTSVYKRVTIDEDGKQVVEYTNGDGLLVQKEVEGSGGSWLTTAYAYDYADRLVCIIPPKAIGSTYFNLNDHQGANGLVYGFRYDDQNRLKEKLTPGRGWTYLVYDRRGNVIMEQDARQRESNQWSFMKYDALDRVVMSGVVTGNDRNYWQNMADGQSGDVYEQRGGGLLGYTNRVVPTNIGEAETVLVNYYDDYGHRSGELGPQRGGGYGNTRGQLTVNKTRNLADNNWLESAFYYDDRGLLIESESKNRFGGVNSTFNEYSFTGELLVQESIYRKPGQGDLSVKERYNYDHAGRKTQAYHAVNGQEITLAIYEYDEIGRLVKKRVQPGSYTTGTSSGGGGTNYPPIITRNSAPSSQEDIASTEVILQPNFEALTGSTYTARIQANSGGGGTATGTTDALQTIEYAYNIRGNLSSVNDGQINTSQNDLFAQRYVYHEDGQYYRGVLRRQEWVSTHGSRANARPAYTYYYDDATRLTTANYSVTGGFSGENYTTNGISYDANGNVLAMTRQGMRQGSNMAPTQYGVIDQISYEYEGNRVQSVSDAQGQGNADTGDFRDRNSGTDYEYYSDGSLKLDRNKQVERIEYNHLGLVTRILLSGGREVQQVYDAAGIKLYKRLLQNGIEQERMDYVGDVLYRNGVPFSIATDEGRVIFKLGDVSKYLYEYHYRDMQGNLRVAYRQQGWPDQLARISMEPGLAPAEEQVSGELKRWRSNQAAYEGGYSARVIKGLGPERTAAVEAGELVTATVYAHYEWGKQNKRQAAVVPVPWVEEQKSPTGEGRGRVVIKGGVLLPAGRISANRATEQARGRFHLAVLDSSGQVLEQVQVAVSPSAQGSWQELKLQLRVRSGGERVRVWTENETDQPVYFDSYTITSQPPVIVEEHHYDPWGLELEGIGYVADGERKERYLYQGKEHEEAFGLEYDDFGWRLYDPQLGRWHAPDPEDQFESPYVGLSNSPVNGIDPDGRFWHIVIGAAIGGVVNVVTHWGKIKNFKDGAAAFLIGAAGGAATAATGGAAAGALGLASTGVVSGAVTGLAGSAVGSPITGIGNAVYFGDEYNLKNFGRDVLMAGGIGGLAGGAAALLQGKNFWTGQVRASNAKPFAFNNAAQLKAEGWSKFRDARTSRFRWARVGADDGLTGYGYSEQLGGFLDETNPYLRYDFSTSAPKTSTNLLKPWGLGSTGRTVARNLTEQLAMKEIMSNPAMGKVIKTGLNDPRWSGWSKMAWHSAGVKIHFVGKFENGVLKAVDDFKFIGGR